MSVLFACTPACQKAALDPINDDCEPLWMLGIEPRNLWKRSQCSLLLSHFYNLIIFFFKKNRLVCEKVLERTNIFHTVYYPVHLS